MGTRATTWIYSYWDGHLPEGKEESLRGPHVLVKIYRQFDGYFEGHGKDLATFLASRKVVNGIGDNDPCFNGAGCCAAQVLWFLKNDRDDTVAEALALPKRPHPRPGNIYVSDIRVEEKEYYHYDVIVHEEGRAGSIEFVATYSGKERFRGTPAEFLKKYSLIKLDDDDDDDDEKPAKKKAKKRPKKKVKLKAKKRSKTKKSAKKEKGVRRAA